MSYSYSVILTPYEGKQFTDATQFGRALRILADKFEHERLTVPRYREIDDIGHGRILDAKWENTDIPSYSWVVTTNND